MHDTQGPNDRDKPPADSGALARISAKGLRRRGDVRSFFERISHPHSAAEAAAAMDRHMRVTMASWTGGLSPLSLGLAVADWIGHLTASPGTLSRLTTEAGLAWSLALRHAVTCTKGSRNDRRYADESWAAWPFCAYASTHRTAETWWQEATVLRGMEHHHEDLMRLLSRQWLDMLAPSNWFWTNPQVLKTTWNTQGANLLRGAGHAFDDWRQSQGLSRLQEDQPLYRPGVEVACTSGDVVYRNHLVELIQYAPSTAKVQREPLFIVPSWIMKYYILDLSPHNSMVRYLVSQGHTVFMLSWRNPDESDALLDMQDYLRLGILEPLAVITERTGGVPIHTTGYCLGGTLLAMAAATLARPQEAQNAPIAPLASMSLLAAQLDFRDAGEMGVLLDEAQVALLEDIMAERGYLTGQQMAGSFQFLRARDLIWSARMREYLLGEPDVANDLMTWNADVTRMPAVMHSNYLHSLYLHNDLAEGRYDVAGEPVSLTDLRLPVFTVGTLKDHVTPWRSAYKVKRLVRSDVTFVLTSGGHNAGVVSEPGHEGRDYQLMLTRASDQRLSPDAWARRAPHFKGSWWPAWHDWLVSHSSGTVAARKVLGAESLCAAPGSYVLVRYLD
jgi:polyhydroxyalkanoate synthase